MAFHLPALRIALPLCALLLTGAARAADQPPMAKDEAPPCLATTVTQKAGLEARVMWMDATANLQRLSTREGVAAVFEKLQKANINTVVVDIKPLSGHVLYNSKIAPKLTEWKGFHYPEGYDLLLTAMVEARRRGIKIYASLNTFCEGHKLVHSGPLYEKPDLQATVYDVERTVTAEDGATWTLAVGENHGPEADQVVSYASGETKVLGPNDAAAVVRGDKVEGIVDGSLTDLGGVGIPADGYLLVGRGTGAKWLLEHLKVGQLLKYTAKEALLPILQAPSEVVGGFVNPADPRNREYMLRIVEELADNYAIDGIVFDRMRYSSLRTDFSPLSRELFEKWLGKKLDRFPQDIYAYDPTPGKPIIQGPYYKQWLEWRATVIRDWLEEARQVAQRKRPGIGLGVYVGSWYTEYYGVGVNWGADDYKAGLDWMTPGYNATGYAGKLTWLTTGCYYPVATRDDARQLGVSEDNTVEAAAQESCRCVNDASYVYAGIEVFDYHNKPEEFRKALEAARKHSQGVMLFDLVYVEEYDWWNILNEAFSDKRRAPHEVPGLLAGIQQARKALKAVPPPQ